MATVKMKKGEKFADIYDSPETIAQARAEGYELVRQATKDDDEDDKSTEKSEVKTPKTKRQ